MSAREEVKATAHRRKGASNHIRSDVMFRKTYLFAYNFSSMLAWSYLLYVTIAHLAGILPQPSPSQSTATAKASLFVKYLVDKIPLALRDVTPFNPVRVGIWDRIPSGIKPYIERSTTLYARIGPEVALIQTTATLELVHSLLGIVRSPFATTLAQVASRLWTVWGIVERFSQTRSNPLYATMVIAWSKAEIIRYAYYAMGILGYDLYWLKWLRYSAFYINYPIGASSEALLSFSTLPPLSTLLSRKWTLDEYFRLALFFVWWPALYGMMSHMSRQRRKVIGKTKRA